MKILHIGVCADGHGSLPTAFKKQCEVYADINTGESNLNEKVIQKAMEMRPDFVFMQLQSEGKVSADTVRSLRSMGAFVMNWSGDVRDPLPAWYYDMAAAVNVSCFSNMIDVYKIRDAGFKAEYLEIGYDETIYCPEGEVLECEPIVFMANNYPNAFPLSKYREEVVNHLKQRFGNRFGVYGNGWAGTQSFNHSQHEEAKKYRGAKIALNISHFNFERYSSDRLLRILGTGVMCISHNFKGIEQDYKVGKHLITFDDLHILPYKIDWFLEHAEDRIKIAHAGNELVKTRNTFNHYVTNMLKIAGL